MPKNIMKRQVSFWKNRKEKSGTDYKCISISIGTESESAKQTHMGPLNHGMFMVY